MGNKLLKQAGILLLIIAALLISQNSGAEVLKRGADIVMKQVSVNYTAGDIKNAAADVYTAAELIPQRAKAVFGAITQRSICGEPVDRECKNGKAAVYAVAAGQVDAVGENEEIGKYIKILHGGEGESLYGNLAKAYVDIPSKVKKGQIIGMFRSDGGKEFYYSFRDFD